MVAVAFHCSISTWVAWGARPRSTAATRASPLDTTGMNALQLHHMMSATIAVRVPDSVSARCFASNSSANFARGAEVTVSFQRSGSRTN